MLSVLGVLGCWCNPTYGLRLGPKTLDGAVNAGALLGSIATIVRSQVWLP